MIFWQINLDFADGALARAQGTSSKLGELLDGLANAFCRSAIIILMGYFTDNIIMLILSFASSFILVSFNGYLFFIDDYTNKNIKTIYKRSLSVVSMNGFLPFLIIIHIIFNFPIFIFSYFIVVFYTLLASLCLFTLVFTKNKMSNNK